ncbi:MAG: PIG-L family deacetylase [Saprospiraceae bacterium]|nr:PIG-L family deacetylase [Saprospiraceae bacterium]
MKNNKFAWFIAGLVLITTLVLIHVAYLHHLASADIYAEDTFLSQTTNKNALIIVAHDDDAISMSGTIAYLTKNGWNVRELCFYQGWKDKDAVRKIDLERAAELLGMQGVEHYDIELRKNREKIEKPWLPVPVNQFDSLYNKEIAFGHIQDFINKYQPSVIFSLDDMMGGYGHPDHVVISKLVIEYCREHQRDSNFAVERIYQAVFDPAMNEKILKNMEAFQLAKKVYNYESSPKPDVFISLRGRESIKKKALLTYTTEQNSLTKIWPYYNLYPAAVYFKIFDKEYYRVLERTNDYR